jgi:hypothetical protein
VGEKVDSDLDSPELLYVVCYYALLQNFVCEDHSCFLAGVNKEKVGVCV